MCRGAVTYLWWFLNEEDHEEDKVVGVNDSCLGGNMEGVKVFTEVSDEGDGYNDYIVLSVKL